MAPLIPVAAAALSTAAPIYAQGRMNKKTREWSEHMYGRQRADSLADWQMQNEYNSPVNQMARLREANLNPHLVYGGGAGNVTGASQAPRSSNVPSWSPKPPDLNLSSLAFGYQNWKLQEAQIDNLKAGETVKVQDAILRAAQTGKTIAETGKTTKSTESIAEQLEFNKSIRSISTDALRASVEKTLADTQFTLSENERKALMFYPNFEKAVEEILTERAKRSVMGAQRQQIYQYIENLKKDGVLKEYDINLRKQGIYPGDPWYIKAATQFIESAPGANIMQKLQNKVGQKVMGLDPRVLENTRKHAPSWIPKF